ncbi:MAG: DUF4080 domain-containing protein [Ruminococcaceae bacterium]|nr:DUF4080 domain-containing protein [Oscillospiraceae bacterium]
MKVLLTALNAKYIHINLALKCLAKYCEEFKPQIKEYTINDNIDSIIANIHQQKADVVAFSCYIWSIEKILYISECLKKINPNVIIILGGHEVSYDADDIIKENSAIDYIIRMEGEKPLKELLKFIKYGGNIKDVPSITYRLGEEIVSNKLSEPVDMNEYEFMYGDEIKDYKGKIIYYESSRGCPYRCSYCLSSNTKKVNFLNVERVKKELMFFIENDVPLVKFVDRTFNADKKRANEIFKFIIENKKNTKFHFELAGNLIDDETIDILKTAPKDLIQFEIGVQSTNKETITAIGRNIEFEKIRENVKKILKLNTIHVHLDLIAGLPFEDYQTFKKSFDDVINIRAQMLQLGFLKLLKGSKIRNEYKKYNYKFKSKAPYEVISNDFITFDELIKLKNIENILDKYYNSGQFKYSIGFLFEKFESKFEIFEKISDYYLKNGFFEISVSYDTQYDILEKIFNIDGFSDCVKMDRMLNNKAKMKYEHSEEFKNKCFEFLKNEGNVKKYLSYFKESSPKKMYSLLRFEKLFGKVYMYDSKNSNLVDVTNDFIM